MKELLLLSSFATHLPNRSLLPYSGQRACVMSCRQTDSYKARRERTAQAAEQRRAAMTAASRSSETIALNSQQSLLRPTDGLVSNDESSGSLQVPDSRAQQMKPLTSSSRMDHDDSLLSASAMADVPVRHSDSDRHLKKRARPYTDNSVDQQGLSSCKRAGAISQKDMVPVGEEETVAESDRHGTNDRRTFRLVSWNTDCLNPEWKTERIQEVCSILLGADESMLPDIILVQEVDEDTYSILWSVLEQAGGYKSYPSQVPIEKRYFTSAFVRPSSVTVDDSSREDFPGSRMGRDLITLRCRFNGQRMLVMTSHFESEKHNADERKHQFSKVLRHLIDYSDGPAIFAGDTNLREPEVKQEKLSKQVGDMWQLCGANTDLRFTWDMLRNDNLKFDGGFQPRARYDRMFVNTAAKDRAKTFNLLGTERMVPPSSCFPSDHFGIDCCFQI